MPDTLIDVVLKLSQISFYAIGGSVAVLTYRSAKRGLLNTVNTEYHKKVLEKLAEMSDDLFSEFDEESDNSWHKQNTTEELLKGVHKEVRFSRHELLTGTDPHRFSIPIIVTKTQRNLEQKEKKYRTDPFIPERIRIAVLSLLSGRTQAYLEIHRSVVEEYVKFLSENPEWGDLKDNTSWVHNRINKRMYQEGFGVSQVEEKVFEIRRLIQEYYSNFDPMIRPTRQRWKQSSNA